MRQIIVVLFFYKNFSQNGPFKIYHLLILVLIKKRLEVCFHKHFLFDSDFFLFCKKIINYKYIEKTNYNHWFLTEG